MRHLYSALLCIAVHPKRFTVMGGGGGSLLNHHMSINTSIITSHVMTAPAEDDYYFSVRLTLGLFRAFRDLTVSP